MRIELDPRIIARLLAAAIVLLVIASMIGQISTYYFGHGRLLGLVRLFALDEEGNVPTWYSSVTLLCCSALLGLIAAAHGRDDRWWRHWAGLALVFLYLSMDEAASIHELSIEPLHDLLGVGGLLRWAWVVPGMLFLAVLAAAYLKFVSALRRPTRRLFCTAAALFVGGALVVEMLSGWWFDQYGNRNMGFVLLWTTEEALEMTGVAVFIFALLRHVRDEVGAIHFSLACRPEAACGRPAPVESIADSVS